MPRVRLSMSGAKFQNKSGKTPGKRSQSQFCISRLRTVGDPQTLENKADSLPRIVSELCCPQYGWYRFRFWRGPSQKQPELVMKFLTVLGARLKDGASGGSLQSPESRAKTSWTTGQGRKMFSMEGGLLVRFCPPSSFLGRPPLAVSGTEKVPQRTFCDKDFAELSGGLSGATCLKNPSFIG